MYEYILTRVMRQLIFLLLISFNLFAADKAERLKNYCDKMESSFKRLNWGEAKCNSLPWNYVRDSVLGDPLIWMAYGDEEAHKKKPLDMTLIMCGIHGDEITPLKFCFDIITMIESKKSDFAGKMIVVAPLVNPDSFFKKKPTRTNQNGVDVNRNFPTEDWDRDAIKMWVNRYGKDRRRNPGRRAMSEPEVLFQVNLIKRYNPNKIISVHAPLTMLDYDGPAIVSKDIKEHAAALPNQLLKQMSEMARGYRVTNYPYFPGSLGNWAGLERKIPTYTLELPSSDPAKHTEFWNLFQNAIKVAIESDFSSLVNGEVAKDSQAIQEKTN